ncbi:MAG: hypothetical protein M0P18_10845 [Syntrophales bacterium]|nr:hypothetical protein [Syntrophales bacterium]
MKKIEGSFYGLIAVLVFLGFVGAIYMAGIVVTRKMQVHVPVDIPDDRDRQRRVHVVRAGVLLDDVAESGRRGVYVITDRDTGVEYIGISGIGIAEVRR